MASDTIKIGQLSQLLGVLPSTIDYYTNVGLLEVSGRTRGGYRLYSKDDTINRIKEIQKLQYRRRLTIGEIREVFGKRGQLYRPRKLDYNKRNKLR